MGTVKADFSKSGYTFWHLTKTA